MTRRTLAALAAAALLPLAACASPADPGTPTATADCEGTCRPELGPPVLRYCSAMNGACDGHPLAPEEVGGHLFAGLSVTGTGTVTR